MGVGIGFIYVNGLFPGIAKEVICYTEVQCPFPDLPRLLLLFYIVMYIIFLVVVGVHLYLYIRWLARVSFEKKSRKKSQLTYTSAISFISK